MEELVISLKRRLAIFLSRKDLEDVILTLSHILCPPLCAVVMRDFFSLWAMSSVFYSGMLWAIQSEEDYMLALIFWFISAAFMQGDVNKFYLNKDIKRLKKAAHEHEERADKYCMYCKKVIDSRSVYCRYCGGEVR